MFNYIEKRFNLIKKTFEKKNLSTFLIEKAFEIAKNLHSTQVRKDGTPYLSHPVEVALILSELDFDEDVISAALLHDVVEDCGYTLTEIQENFNNNVSELVDCVSSIDNAKYVLDKENLYEDENFFKLSVEDQTFKKLIKIGKNNPSGFCIKFADRLHNLRTIECFSYNKQLEKVRETEKWILPIAKILKTEFFYRNIQNECFKIVNRYNGINYFKHYSFYHNSNKNNIDNLSFKLKEKFANTTIKEVIIKDILEYKVYDDLKEQFKNLNINMVSQGRMLNVANYNIYLIYENDTLKNVIKLVFKAFDKNLSKKIKIIDAKVGRFTNKIYFEIEDDIQNKYNLFILTKNEYVLQNIGNLDKHIGDVLTEENVDDLNLDYIKVKTRSNETKFIAKNSTALDFAFKIHKDLGFGFKYAIINNSKNKFPAFTKLNDNDRVEIVCVTDENNNITNQAQLKWLAYVNTDYAKKTLIKYFEKIINKA